jgi:hypothetical protein
MATPQKIAPTILSTRDMQRNKKWASLNSSKNKMIDRERFILFGNACH